MTCSKRLINALEQESIPFENVSHLRDYTAQETAHHTHTPGAQFAKTVLLRADGRFAMAVLPANERLDWTKARSALNASEARLASEEESRQIFSDCEVGAEPPFGNLYDVPVYVSEDLDRSGDIVFNAGTHEDAVKMKYTDYEKLVHPKVVQFH